jgi:hypothetical protein
MLVTATTTFGIVLHINYKVTCKVMLDIGRRLLCHTPLTPVAQTDT